MTPPPDSPTSDQEGQRQWPHPSLPIVPHLPAEITKDERRAAVSLAKQLLSEEPALGATAPFGPQVTVGLGPWPSLVLEDHSAITLFETKGDPAYSYRALLLAGEGDLVAIGVPRSLAFESYCRDQLGLGKVEILTPRPGLKPLALRCAEDAKLIGRAAAVARDGGGLNLIPYMGTGGVWKLAGIIAESANAAVRVAAPPPRLVRRVNDKLWFAARITELLGGRALPPAHPSFGLASLSGRLANLARHYRAVAVKVPSSASSSGNIVLDSREVTGLPLRTLRNLLQHRLQRAGWRDEFPLMVTAWESPIVASPSVQLWIPEPQNGEIAVEGIFDQTVTGPARVFSGAMPTGLKPEWQARLARESVQVGTVFQALGYFGRCSFDSILVGENEATAHLQWIECNGRWGGTSIPMTLANRLVGDWRRRPFVIIERDDLRGPGRDVGTFLESIAEDLYLPGRREDGAVLLSPGQVERGTGYELMVLGETIEAARRQAERLAESLVSSDRS